MQDPSAFKGLPPLKNRPKGRTSLDSLMKYACSIFILLLTVSVWGQDLEPRTLSNAPVGLNFVVVGYQYAAGNVLFDPSLPIEDAKANMHGTVAAYVRTINFFGLSGKVDVVVPFVIDSHWEGLLEGQPASTTRTGFPDPQIRLSFNFIGSPALSPQEFVAYQEKTIAGFSLQVRPPLGKYDGNRLVNLGSNRWTIRPHLGISQRWGQFIMEGHCSIWLFTPNPDLLGVKMTQKPIYAIKSHATYLFGRGFWLALDAGYGFGGQTTVDGFPKQKQKNIRLGGTLNIPVARQHALKLRFASGVQTKVGTDFDSLILAYQYMWANNRDSSKKDPGKEGKNNR